jgi:hypothetical protein
MDVGIRPSSRLPHSRSVRLLVNEYCSGWRNVSLPKFVVHGPHTLDGWRKADASSKAGCHAVYDVDGSLRYIGMSLTNIGNRLGTHLSEATQRHPFWQQGPAYYVDIIEVTQPWEAPSLEAFLYAKTEIGS